MTIPNNGFSIESAEVQHRGAVVTTEVLSVRTPDGDLVERQAVRHPGAVAVVAVHDGAVVLVQQYRAPVDADTIEIPAGKLDIAGEDPADAARRELIEEVGLQTDELIELGSFLTAVGFSDEIIHIYAATSCHEVPRAVDGVEEAHSSIIRLPLGDVDEWLASGRLDDAKTLIGLFWARDRGLLHQ